jgi:hypothetical protein
MNLHQTPKSRKVRHRKRRTAICATIATGGVDTKAIGAIANLKLKNTKSNQKFAEQHDSQYVDEDDEVCRALGKQTSAGNDQSWMMVHGTPHR